VKEIVMKKPRTVADLLAVADICIEASEVRARLFESCGKGGSQRRSTTIGKSTQLIGEIAKITETASNSSWIRKRRGISIALTIQRSGVRSIVPRDVIWKSAKLFWIVRRCRHQQHRWPRNLVEQMGEINVIFRGSMFIVSKTQGKKLEWEISLAQRIELGRKMRWSDVDISFGLEDYPETELFDRNLPFVVKLLIGRHKVVKDIDRQRGLIKSYHKENLHRDVPQSERLDSCT
jgi:hypothetical protein